MTAFTIQKIKSEIASLETVYDYLKSNIMFDSSAFELATVIYTTICTLKSSIDYETTLSNKLELPFAATLNDFFYAA